MFTAWIAGAGLLFMTVSTAAQVTAAVASNFAPTFEKVIPLLPVSTSVVSGSTGKLFAQIKAGAPFDVFFSADERTPTQLVENGFAVAASLRAYARGTLVLWAAAPDAKAYLSLGQCLRIALANPRVAPYGRAARDVLERMGLWSAVQEKLVMGENIQQTWQFVYTGNVDCGFVAAAQVQSAPALAEGMPGGVSWFIPEDLYAPIVQVAVVLNRSRDPVAAQRVLDAFRTPEVRAILQHDGYLTPE